MRKRLSSKLLAVILTVAICATTVLACLMTASAAESCYSFGAPEFSEDHTQVTIDVTFNAPEALPDGFAAGAFTLTEVDADGTDYLTVKSVVPVTENINLENEGNYYVFDGPLSETATFKITFGFSNGVASEGATYKVKLTEVELAANDGAYFIPDADNGAVAEITTACNHVVAVVGDPVATGVGGDYGYAVYESSVCTLCGETFGYQLVPSSEALEGSESAGTIDLLEFSDSLVTNGSTSKYYDTNVADNGETGADWANAIIIDSAEEFVYLCKASGNETAGKYYKVADGIAGFNLSSAGLNVNGTLEDNYAIVRGSGKNHSGGTPGFQGHFDGNGATVYGAWTNHTSVADYGGLFSCVKGDVTIKNVNVKFASFTAKSAAGGIVGYHSGDGTNTLTIENCSVTESEIVSTGTNWGNGAGAIVGFMSNCSSFTDTNDTDGDGNTTETIYVNGGLNIKNCYVNLDATYFTSGMTSDNQALHGGVVGFVNSNAMKVENCVVIGIKPYATTTNTSNNNVQHTGLESHFTNVYTDQAAGSAVYIGGSLGNRNFTGRVTQVASVKGSAAVVAMPNLDWGTTWVMDGTDTYPRLALPGETFDTIYWDGANTKTAPTVGSGTKDDPYIISTVAELAYIGGQTRDNYAITDGKYYKIADGIKSIVMQPYAYGADIKALDSAAATKAYFEANAANMKQWLYYGWEGSTFCGSIDFNGATVYGIYQVSSSNAGLFSSIDAGAAFHNLTIKNSYMVSQSSAANYQCGAIGAVTNGATYGKAATGFIWAKNCTIANNYMYDNTTQHDRAGVMFGASSDIMYVDNCLVYGNDATYGSGVPMPLYSSANNSTLVSSAPAIPEGLVVVDDGAETPRYRNMTRNSIFLGFNPFDLAQGFGSRFNDLRGYQNCYTDAAVETDTDANGKTVLEYFYVNSSTPYITQINAADVLGQGAQTAMPDLTWGTDWFAGAEGEYPAQTPYVTFGVESHSNKDFDLVGANLVYNDDGSISLNVHYIPAYEGFAPTLYVGDTDCTKLLILDTPVASSKRAEIGDDTAMMFTITGLSAKYINTKWHPTLVALNGAAVNWSQSVDISIADVATATLAGDYSTADKNVAAAVLQYGGASIDAINTTTNDYNPGVVDLLEFGQYLVDAGSTSKWYDTKLADNGETGDSWENAIIIDSAEEFVYLAKASGNDTAGKYYKVADGIAGFDLSNGKLDYTKGLAANLATIKGSGKNHSGGTPGFQGNFDGNGVTVYGAWTNHTEGNVAAFAGLFTCTQGEVTIKNVHVKLASFTAKTGVGGIVGYYKGTGNYTSNTTLTIENCSVTDSHLEITTAGSNTALGAIVGRVDVPSGYTDTNDEDKDNSTTDTVYVNNKINVTNCYVNLDENYFISASEDNDSTTDKTHHGGVVAYAGTNAVMVSKCIVIGVTPYPVTEDTTGNQIQHTGHANNFSNVYTDQTVSKTTYVGGTTANGLQDLTTVMTQLTTEQLTGAAAKENMPALDWANTWTTTTTYPTFINKDYKAPASGVVVTWDGTVATGFASGTGTKEDPYIISTGAEFAYMVKDKLVDQAATISLDKYFKVADGISAFVMQKPAYAAEIMALSSAAETKAYFEANAANMLKWPNYSWEGSSFCGYFDGNGATVYGLYQTSANNAGLFSSIDAGAAILNIGVKNSYLTSSSTSYQVAAIAPVANSSSYGAKQEGVVWVNGCTVANNYMYNACTSWERSGVIAGGFSNDIIMIDNCLVYGNDATYGDGVKMALTGVGNNDVETTKKTPAELPSYVENSGFFCNTVRNSIILDCDAMNTAGGRSYRRNAPNCFVNVYTNAASGTVTVSNGEWTYDDAEIKAINAADVMGDTGSSIINALNAAPIGDTVWYVGATADYPGFKEAGALSTGLQAIYDSIELTPDTVGPGVVYNDKGTMDFGVYATSVNLNTNPYISFAFAFNKQYKTNRGDIQIRFTYVLDDANVTTDPITVPAFEGDGTLNYKDHGWYNTPSNGRYHIYRFKDIPVEALGSGIKVEASYQNGEWLDFGTYSVAGLAYEFECSNKTTPSDYYATRIEAAKALLFYTQMLQIRY